VNRVLVSDGRRRFRRLLMVCAAALLFLAAQVAPASAARLPEPMNPVPETGQPGLLGLTSSVYPLEVPALAPGDHFSWQIGVHLEDQPLGDGSLELVADGALAVPGHGYELTARRCGTQWSGTSGTNAEMTCSSGASPLGADLLQKQSARIDLGDLEASRTPYVLFTLSLPENGSPAGPFTFGLGFTAMGDEDQRENSLADTGFGAIGVLSAALVVVAAGFGLNALGRKRSTR
jgi:hypothetical protein